MASPVCVICLGDGEPGDGCRTCGEHVCGECALLIASTRREVRRRLSCETCGAGVVAFAARCAGCRRAACREYETCRLRRGEHLVRSQYGVGRVALTLDMVCAMAPPCTHNPCECDGRARATARRKFGLEQFRLFLVRPGTPDESLICNGCLAAAKAIAAAARAEAEARARQSLAEAPPPWRPAALSLSFEQYAAQLASTSPPPTPTQPEDSPLGAARPVEPLPLFERPSSPFAHAAQSGQNGVELTTLSGADRGH